jgi:hypothetical protein
MWVYMSPKITKEARLATIEVVKATFPIGSCIRDKKTGKIFVIGKEQRGEFWVMSTGRHPEKFNIPALKVLEEFETPGWENERCLPC